MITVYGIKNCNTMQKAFTWLKLNDIAFEFHDYKKDGISNDKIEEWISQISPDKLINKSGLTYKKLDDEGKSLLANKDSAIRLMIEKSSMIKRPLLETPRGILLGFHEEEWKSFFNL